MREWTRSQLIQMGAIDGQFKPVALLTLEKQDFLSVNYEPPRVAEFLKKAGSLILAADESLRRALGKMADDSFAANFACLAVVVVIIRNFRLKDRKKC